MGRQEMAAQVDLDHGVPLVDAHLRDGAVAQDAGVVDQRVEPSERVDRRCDQPARGVVLGAVARVQHRFSTCRSDLLDHCLADLGIELVDHHASAFASQFESLPAPDAATRAGDDCDLAVHETHAGDTTQRQHQDRAAGSCPKTAGHPGSEANGEKPEVGVQTRLQLLHDRFGFAMR
jgi:hypothetical protein